jgi:methylenetetrahydrofolate dehydrogenase (NADP+) / methenyltetrahydrofolate cyclohydrolase
MKHVTKGRELASQLLAQVAVAALKVEHLLGRRAALAIVHSSDADANRFVDIKRERLGPAHIDVRSVQFEPLTSQKEAAGQIARLNYDDSIDAIFLQFPLPDDVQPQALADSIAPDKDIDCSSEEAEADFQRGASRYTPVAPLASLELLRDQLGSLTGRSVILYGDDDFFVRCLRTLLQNDGAVVRLFPRQSNEPVGAADALVVSESLPPVAMLQSIERLELLLDAGYYMKPRPATWIPPEIAARIDNHLGQYQNVGPLTVAHLADATVLAAHGRIRSRI